MYIVFTNLTAAHFSFYYYHFNAFDPNAVMYVPIAPIYNNNCVFKSALGRFDEQFHSMIDTTQHTVAHVQYIIVFASIFLPFLSFFLFLSLIVSTLQCCFPFFCPFSSNDLFHWMHFFHTLPLCACPLFVSTQMWIMRNSIYLTTHWECHRHYSLMAIPYYV